MRVDNANINLSNLKKVDTMAPLTWVLKILAINCNGRQKSASSQRIAKFLAGSIVGLFNLYTLYCKISYVYKKIELDVSIEFTDIVISIFSHCQYIVDLMLVHKYGSEISQQCEKQCDEIDKIIGMSCIYYKSIQSRLLKLVVLFIVAWSTTTVFDFIVWAISYGWYIPIFFSTFYLYLLIKIATTLDLTAHVMNVEYRLRVMGDIMHYYYSTCEVIEGGEIVSDVVINNAWFYKSTSDKTRHLNQFNFLKFGSYHELKFLSRCYLLLTEQVVFINCIFGMRIVLNSLSLLVDMIRIANIVIRIALNAFGQKTIPEASFYLLIISNTLRFLVNVFVLLSLMYHCEQAYRQSDRILRIIDHLLVNKNPDPGLRNAATEFRDLVRSRPICFCMVDFLKLNYSVLVSIASVVVTYTIILFQF